MDIDLRTVLIDAIRKTASTNRYCYSVPGPYVATAYADAVIDVLLDLAGTGKLIASLNTIASPRE
jgi:hypothetical protein